MPVSLSVGVMQEVAERTNGCTVWSGAIDLSPADDIFVKIEYHLSIDPLLLPSIMSKKKAVGANILVIDIPCGRGTKQSIPGRVNADPQRPIRKSHNHHGGRPDLAQDLDMMLLSRQHSTGLLHSVRLTGTQFTEECWACNSPLYQHLSRPGCMNYDLAFGHASTLIMACIFASIAGMRISINLRAKEPSRIAGSLVLAAQNATYSYRHD